MKTIIAGSRSISSYRLVSKIITQAAYEITEIVSGHAIGVDQLGERFAKEKNLSIKLFIPNWKRYGKRAGILRNIQMAKYADALIAIWDGKSVGTKHMITVANQKNLRMFVHKIGNKQ